MKGKTPTMNVMAKLMERAVKALSPSIRETIMLMNMNRALTRRATPTFLDIALRFIFSLVLFQFLEPEAEQTVLFGDFGDSCIQLR